MADVISQTEEKNETIHPFAARDVNWLLDERAATRSGHPS